MIKKNTYALLLILLINLFSGCRQDSGFVDSTDNAGHRVIIKNEKSVKQFLQYQGIIHDSVWIPNETDLADISRALEDYLQDEIKNSNDDWQRVNYQKIIDDLIRYNKELSGFIRDNKKFVICNMQLRGNRLRANTDEIDEFTIIFDGGCSVVRFIYDIENNKIVSLECNAVA